MTLSGMLERAGVSRTAYYSLSRRASVLPGSVHAMAHALGVEVSVLLEPASLTTEQEANTLVAEAKRIVALHPEASFGNVWHTLVLLRESPVERLNRSLRRGRAFAVHE